MSHKVILHYDERLIRRAVLRSWWRVVSGRLLFYLALEAIILGALISMGNTSWLVGFMGGALTVHVVMALAVYVIRYRIAIQTLEKMGKPEAVFTISEATLSVSTGAGSVTVPWSGVAELRQFPDFWLLFFSKRDYVTLPLSDFTPAAKEFLVGRVQSAGGKIR